MDWSERLRALDERIVGKPPKHYPRGCAEVVQPDDFVTQFDASRELGISVGRVGWRVACEHLQPAEDENRTMGVTRASVDQELAWARSAGLWAKWRRVLSNTFRWV